MSEPQAPPTNNNPQMSYLDELREEAKLLNPGEREEQEALIAELAGEVALAESIQQQADVDIAAAKALATQTCSKTPETSTASIKVDYDQIGWISNSGAESLTPEAVHTPSSDYLFIDLISEGRLTKKLFEHLVDTGEADKLLKKVKDDAIPQLWMSVLAGREQSVSVGKRSVKQVEPDNSLNTTYPAYKLDAHGTNNRAIVLLLGKHDGLPVFGLAALYDHKHQREVYNNMFLKVPKQRRQG